MKRKLVKTGGSRAVRRARPQRTGVGCGAAELFLRVNGVELDAGDEEFDALTVSTAAGHVDAEALAIWFRQRIKE